MGKGHTIQGVIQYKMIEENGTSITIVEVGLVGLGPSTGAGSADVLADRSTTREEHIVLSYRLWPSY